MPLDEGAQEINLVGGGQFRAQLETEAGVALGVGEKRRVGEGVHRPDGVYALRLLLGDGEQVARARGDHVHPLAGALQRAHRLKNVVGGLDLIVRRQVRQDIMNGPADMASQHSRSVFTDMGGDSPPSVGRQFLELLLHPQRDQLFVQPAYGLFPVVKPCSQHAGAHPLGSTSKDQVCEGSDRREEAAEAD